MRAPLMLPPEPYDRDYITTEGSIRMDTIETRVAAGADWLDRQKPGWWRDIDLGKLDMGDGCLCVLGQVYADAADTGENGFNFATTVLLDGENADYLGGFNARWPWELNGDQFVRAVTEAFAQLGTEWKRLIAARRAGESS